MSILYFNRADVIKKKKKKVQVKITGVYAFQRFIGPLGGEAQQTVSNDTIVVEAGRLIITVLTV